MALTISNPTYASQGPSKTGQVLAPNELSNFENAFVGRVTITLDGATTTGTINFIDGTQAIFAKGDAAGTTVAPVAVEASIVGGTQSPSAAVAIATGTPTTTGFPFYMSAAGTNGNTHVVQFYAYPK